MAKKTIQSALLIFALLHGTLSHANPCVWLYSENSLPAPDTNPSVVNPRALKAKLRKMGIEEKSPKWLRLLFPEYKEGDERTDVARLYVKNTTRALETFAQYFESTAPAKEDEFIEMFSSQHKATILGTNPRKPYYGFFLGRGSIDQEVDDLVSEASRAHRRVNRSAMKALVVKEARESAGNLRKDDIRLHLNEFLFGYDKEKKAAISKLIDEPVSNSVLPEKAWGKNTIGSVEWFHEYPGVDQLPVYLSAMHQLLEKIKSCKSCSESEVLGLISDYYYTGINAHFFFRVNQSLLMSQVNYLLLKRGYSGLSHHSRSELKIPIDGAALIMNSENFKKFFKREIRLQQ